MHMLRVRFCFVLSGTIYNGNRWFNFFNIKLQRKILMTHYFEIQELKCHYTRFIRFELNLNNYELQNCEWVDEGKSL